MPEIALRDQVDFPGREADRPTLTIYWNTRMTPFRAAAGVVDRLQGLPLPKAINLYATLIAKKPNHDGGGYEPSDVVSYSPVPIQFGWDRHELRNDARVRIFLIEGSWSDLYIQLQDEDGEPFGKGAVALGGSAAH